MNFFLKFMKVTGEFMWWTIVNCLWKPAKWVTVGTYTAWKDSKKKPEPEPVTDNAVNDAQAAASKHLPKLTKQRDEIKTKMDKLSDEWNKLKVEFDRIDSVIYVASGEFVKPRAKSKGNQNNQNNNQKQKGNQQNQNNGQKKVPVIGDADFAN